MNQKDIWRGFLIGSIAIFSLVVLLFVYFLLRGVVVATLWNWFVVPLGVPSLTWTGALGVSLLISALIPFNYQDIKKEKALERLLVPVFHLFWVLGLGYLIQWLT